MSQWTFRNRQYNVERTEALDLAWEANGSSLPYDEDVHGEDAWEMWLDWLTRHGKGDNATVSIYWSVGSVGEQAPFLDGYGDQDFLTYFTWPEDANGNRLRWTDLPVSDGKSVWIYELTGWRPAPFTPSMPVAAIAAACELPPPRPRTP